jgi:hypothetical protein
LKAALIAPVTCVRRKSRCLLLALSVVPDAVDDSEPLPLLQPGFW